MSLEALTPPPAALEPGASPPWPEPTGQFVPPLPPQLGTAYGWIAIALVPALMAFFSVFESKRHGYGKSWFFLAVAVLVAVIGFAKLRSAKALLPAQRAREARSRRAWARIKSSKVKEERRDRGTVTRYLLDLELEIWEVPGAGAGSTHRTAPSSVSAQVETSVPAALAPQVLPGAFFAVSYDPIDHVAIPFTLLTRDGAQFPL